MFINGMDISMLKELEESGAKYFHEEREKDIFDIFKKFNVNLIRLRLWIDPYDEDGEAYGGGTNDLETTLALAKRAAERGFSLMLDFHYSDFWADPSKQHKPKAWQGLAGAELQDSLSSYTSSVLSKMAQNGTSPHFVQIGNEITNGLLWPDGHIDNSATMASLLSCGIKAVRDFDRHIRIILHLDYGTDNQMYRNWLRRIEEHHLDYDIIGMSYYPYWNGSLQKLLYNMDDISSYYNKDVIVIETAYGYTACNLGCEGMIFNEELAMKVPYPPSKEGQKSYMLDLIDTIKKVKDNRGLGFVYWEPAWLAIPECAWTKAPGFRYLENDNGIIGNSWANQALFDEKGNSNPAFEELGKEKSI
ncbi:MAG: glycosyl hydrolase 53 family protein [Lachnospiraceae bacterium]|nr:glycosyl hydrolase 53 family protein [Lachnospiraceae bacterium]